MGASDYNLRIACAHVESSIRYNWILRCGVANHVKGQGEIICSHIQRAGALLFVVNLESAILSILGKDRIANISESIVLASGRNKSTINGRR